MPSYSDIVAQVFETEKFSNELHRIAIDTVINRLDSAKSKVSEHELLRFIQKLFDKSSDEHQNVVKCETQNSRSNTCLLKVEVVKGENLASKDYDGLSDPFCVVAVVPTSKYVDLQEKKYSSRTTKIASSLNPEWNENVEFVLNRNEISNSYVQLQVWDYDGANNNKKKVKGIKGFTRLVHDNLLSVSSDQNDHKDDFMGYKSVNLSKIPDDGLEKWLKCKAAHMHLLQRVFGRIKVKLSLTPIITNEESPLSYSTDLLYAGLLRKILNKCYQDCVKENSYLDCCWKAAISPSAKILLNTFLKLYHLPQSILTFAMWEIYAEFHLKNFPGIEAFLIQDLLNNFEVEKNKFGDFQFSADMFSVSIEKFIQKECEKLAGHRDLFPTDKKTHIKYFENLLLILGHLGNKNFQEKIKLLFPDKEHDVRVSVLSALENGSSGYYTILHSRHIDESKDKVESKNNNQQYKDVDIDKMVVLTETLVKNLTESRDAYGEVFQQCFGINYVACVGCVFRKHLAYPMDNVVKKINGLLCKHSAEFALEDADSWEFRATEVDAPNAITLQSHKQWFLYVVREWVELSKQENQKVLENAVRLDESFRRVDFIVKHSSSAVDTMACLYEIVNSWNIWEWPSPFDSCTIARWLANNISSAVELYAKLIYDKLKSVGFFDDEGQFDITEQLCIALNNLRVVKLFLLELPKKMHFQKLADDVAASCEGPSGEEALNKLNTVVNEADQRMEEKIEMVSTEVGARMKPDIAKHLTNFAEDVIARKNEIDCKDFGNSEILKSLREIADEASQPLKKYLANNLETLSNWLNEKNFSIILNFLWKNVLESAHKVLFEDFVQQHKPAFFHQSLFLLDNLLDFFHEDGNGLSFGQMKNLEDYKQLEAGLKIGSASTGELVKMFYLQIYEQQEKFASNPCNGVLDVFSWYDVKDGLLHVDVICATDLAPLYINGSSSPFVQLQLSPPMLFKEKPTYQTSLKKKTLNPLWNETFFFNVERKAMEEEGTVIIFAVLNYDSKGSNQLKGEGVIPLKIILENAEQAAKNDGKIEKHFKLALVREKKRKFLSKLTHRNEDESSEGMEFDAQAPVSPLQVIRRRCASDKEAEEFLQSRRKFKKAKKTR